MNKNNFFQNRISANLTQIEFLNRITNSNLKVISFDIFDTLLYRKTFEPNNVFLNIQNEYDLEEDFYYKRIYKESLARKISNKEDIHLKDIYNEFISNENLEQYINYELMIENDLLYVNIEIEKWIELAHKNNKKVILISDIYFSKKDITNLLSKKLKNFDYISEIYTSSDIGLLKSTSNLYKYVLDKEKIEKDELLHIGDNIISDITITNLLNIESIYTGKSSNISKCQEIEKSILSYDFKYQALRVHASSFYEKSSIKNSTLFEIGAYVFGPILYNFCIWLLDYTIENNLKQINLFMREGRIFHKLLKSIQQEYKCYAHIELNLIFASRTSLYFPFLNSEKLTTSNLIYGQMTIKDYYNLHRIDIHNDLIIEYSQYELSLTKKIFINDTSLYNIIHQDLYTNKEEIIKQSLIQSELFKKYLNQINYKSNSVLVDFGGGGTILETFNELTKENAPKKNVLFFKKDLAFNKNISFDSFIPYLNKNQTINNTILNIAPIIEALFNGEEGTTLSYAQEEDFIKPITGQSISISNEFDDGVLHYLKTIFDFKIKKESIRLKERIISSEILYRFLTLPTKEEAFCIGKIPQEKDISGYNQINILNKTSQELFNKLGIEKYYCDLIQKPNSNHLLKCIWPQGQIALNNASYLHKIQNINHSTISTYIEHIINIIIKNKIRNIGIYGAGELFINLYKEIIVQEIEVVIDYIIMSNKQENTKYFKWEIITPQEALDKNITNIVIASLSYKDEMINILNDLKKDKDLNMIYYTQEINFE